MGHAHPAVVDAVTEAASKGLSFGAATQGEVLLAEQVVANVPGVESLRLVNSGTEAVMSATVWLVDLRAENALLVTGCYHGHSDGLLVGRFGSHDPRCSGQCWCSRRFYRIDCAGKL